MMINYFNQDTHKEFMSLITEKKGEHFHASQYPRSETGDLTWGSINAKISNTPATVQAFGTKARNVKRDDMTKKSGNINPIERSYALDEKLMLNLDNERFKTMILNGIFDDSLNAYNSVNTRLDAISMAQQSTGKVIYSSINNVGGIDVQYIDYDLESWQEVNVATSWAVPANATPIKDIREKTHLLNDKGFYPEVIRMTRTIFNYMMDTNEVKSILGLKITKANITSNFLAVAEMNVFMDQKDLPIIEIVKDDISYEKADGTFDHTRRAWAEGKVQFGYKREGRSLWVEPIEYTKKQLYKNTLITITDGIIVQKYSELNPPAMITMAKGIIFPAWDRSNQVLILDVTP